MAAARPGSWITRMVGTGGADDGAPGLGPDFTVEVVDAPGPGWDEMTAHFADANYEQTVAYAACRWGARRLAGVVLRDGRRQVVGAALAVTFALPLVKGGFAYVKFGPLWRAKGREPSKEILLRTLLAVRQEFGARRGLLVRVTPPVDPGFSSEWQGALHDASFALRNVFPHPERYLMNVSLTADEQLASFHKSWRASLRKAAPDLQFEELTGLAAAEEFRTIFRAMLERKRFDDRHGLEALPALVTHPVAAHRMRVFVARHGGVAVAASAVGGAGDTLHVLFGATADEALPLRAAYGLRRWVLDRLRDSGARWLDLGGHEGNDGLRHYKEGCAGKRGSVVPLPGEFDWCDRRLNRIAARMLGVAREILTHPRVRRLLRRR